MRERIGRARFSIRKKAVATSVHNQVEKKKDFLIDGRKEKTYVKEKKENSETIVEDHVSLV